VPVVNTSYLECKNDAHRTATNIGIKAAAPSLIVFCLSRPEEMITAASVISASQGSANAFAKKAAP